MIKALLEISLCLLVLFCIYKLVLEQTSLHRFKRVYLLFCLLFSLAIPFLEFEITSENPIIASTEKVTDTIYEVILGSESSGEISAPEGFVREEVETAKNNGWLIYTGYSLVALILLIRFGRNIYRLLRKAFSHTRIPYKEAEVALLNEAAIPHNFLKYIFINKEDYRNEGLRDRLLAHELGHAKQKHSLDILLVEFLQAIFWFNPLYHFYGKAIRLNHEYLADSIVLKSFKDVAQYQILLLQFGNRKQGGELNLACLSNYSLTKKRFKMMTQHTSKIAAMVRVAILLPLLVVTILAFGLNTQASELIESSTNVIIGNIESSIFQENTPEILPLAEEDVLKVTSNFGMRKDPISGDQKMHYGIDFSAQTGKPVVASASGTVEKAESLAGGYGKYIQIKHDGQYQTLYAQLSEINVEVGDKVEKGQVIGKVGSTGHSTGPHLHYEVIKDGKRVDPKGYFEAIPDFRPVIIKDGKVSDPNNQAKYDLKEENYAVTFGYGYNYVKIIYDDESALFFKKDKEPITKRITELSSEQIDALKALTLSPPPYYAKNQPINEIVDNWLDSTIYGIWIDHKKVDNSVMSNYKASDFAYYTKNGLSTSAKKGKVYNYQLNLITNEKYEKDKVQRAEERVEWDRTTKALLAMLDF
jgi:murein DD-endopeptidase MepM/ murein hydrolase activator NlpD